MTTTTIPACNRNVTLQLIVVVIRPPIRGPAAAPMPAIPLITPNARARDSMSSKNSVARMYTGGIIRALPIPSSAE